MGGTLGSGARAGNRWDIGEGLEEGQKEELTGVLEKARDAFAYSLAELGKCNRTEMEIDLQSSEPVYQRRRRLSPGDRDIAIAKCKEVLAASLIQESTSEYAAATVVAVHKYLTGEMLARRMWEDYRGLNRMTKSDRYPMPMAEEIFDKLAEGRIYSTLDLRQRFNQIPIKEEDKAKTAFHGGGVDVPSREMPLGVKTVAYLGFQVGEGGLSVQQAKAEVVDRLKASTDRSTLRAQLGFLRYYRRFIPNFSKTAKPLNQLLSEDEGWKGGKEQERAWTTLKEAVKTALLLKLPNPDEPFLLYTDWSSSGMCTVLCQEEKGMERVVAYASRSCSPAESNYSSYEGEGLAAVWGIALFRPYLQGRKFTLVTDHQPLLWLMTNQTPKDRKGKKFLRGDYPKKCHFGVTTVAYLGFQVGEGGLSVQQAKVEVVDRLKAPTDCSTLRAQLGFLSYYRRFIPNFSKTAKPLSQLLRKDEGWKWWKEQERAWTTLKEAVKTAPLLKLPNPDEPFLLYTDWSSSGMCTVLCQEEKGTERVVAYVSRSCSPAESNYSSYEGEGLAAVWAVELFRPYLQGRKFTLVTDHQPLLWLMTNQTLKDRNARWAMHLQEFEFDVKHRPGKDFAACGWPNSPEARGRREERGAGRGRTYLYGGGPGEGGMEPEDRDSKGQLRDLGRPASARLGFRAGDRKGKKFLRGCECGGVHYRWQTDQQQLVTEDGWRIVPRPEEREALIVKVHTQLGHYAVERTVQMLQTMYWWAGLRREVKEVLARCEPCSQSKAKLERTKAELQSLPIGSIGYRWSLDMVGEMPLSRRGKQYIP
ncbi:hypothetical protein CLOP_g8591 [Closterium sp. NIES-67]|nr:hypothetical protein CLOP_g8591 [Closterium sp. NIES-67]